MWVEMVIDTSTNFHHNEDLINYAGGGVKGHEYPNAIYTKVAFIILLMQTRWAAGEGGVVWDSKVG